jgi:hypothetical protein
MTEHTVPMAGTALAEPPAPVLPPGAEDDAADAGNRRKLLLVGGALGAVVVLLAAYFLLKGGSDTPATSSSPLLPHHVAAAPAKTGHHAKTTKPVKLPTAFKGNVGRDPFKPLYVAPLAPAAGSGAGTSTPGQTDSSGTGGSTSSTDGSTGSTTGSNGGSTTHAPVYRPIWLQLRKISDHTAVFAIGFSNRHSLKVFRFTVKAPKGNSGTVFAKSFSLLSLSGHVATVQYGDGTPFLLDLQHNTMIVN